MKAVCSEIIALPTRVKEHKLPFWKYTTGQYRPTRANDWDICYKYEYPYNVLCNFSPSHFFFDGIEINSMEGFLQALKIEDPVIQKKICTMPGFLAKKLGNYLKRSGQFDREHLYWNGKRYDRYSKEYLELLKRAYNAKFRQDKAFREVLGLSRGFHLTHDIGKTDPYDTVLTEAEFIANLERLRSKRPQISISEYLSDIIREKNILPRNPIAIAKALKDVQTTTINGHFICGESLFTGKHQKYLDKKYGIKNVIDINIGRAEAEIRKIICEKKGLSYINITTHECDIDAIKSLISSYNNGEFSYINCFERQEANIPLAINYLFNPKADIADAILFGSPRRTFINSLKRICKQIYYQDKKPDKEFSDITELRNRIKILSELN